MSTVLSYAQSGDNSDSNLVMLVICAGVVIAVCVLAFIPVRLAWGRRHRQADAVTIAAIFWALVMAGSLVYTVVQQLEYSKERLLDIQTGYYDPQTTSDAPSKPWVTWGVLAAIYGLVVVWSASQGRPAPAPADPPGPQPPA